MRYRSEIDGLRAVAVLPVILFHAGMPGFGGGFVGVDIFFVISGFLITGILIDELQRGDWSILRFYERRARRILPALFVVSMACLPFAWRWMAAPEFEEFSKSLIAVALFVSNIWFWRSDDYFASAAELKPLLHTWSLAVEEQFYLVFPLLLLILWRFGRRASVISLAGLAVASLLLAEWGSRNAPMANFYLAPARGWELLTGSLCAFVVARRGLRQSDPLAYAGLAMIAFAVFGYDETIPTPSLYLLVPVLGTALVLLFAGGTGRAARLLSARALVAVGLISYSLYLWHQPLFAFARIRSIGTPSPWLMAGLVVLCFALAWATWRFVEQPFRGRAGRAQVSRTGIFVLSGLAGAVMLAVGGAGTWSQGFPSRFQIDPLVQADLSERRLQAECFDRSDFCRVGASDASALTLAALGDSHALSYFGPLDAWGKRHGVRVLLNGISGCPPLVDTFVLRKDEKRQLCAERNAAFLNAAAREADAVLLIARWSYYGFGDITGKTLSIGRTFDVTEDPQASLDVFWSKVDETLAAFSAQGLPVLVVGQPPLQKVDPNDVFQRASRAGGDADAVSAALSVGLDEHLANYGPLQDRLRAIVAKIQSPRVGIVDIAPQLCDPVCQIARGGRSMYFDDDHLSGHGAETVLPFILEAVATLSGRQAFAAE